MCGGVERETVKMDFGSGGEERMEVLDVNWSAKESD